MPNVTVNSNFVKQLDKLRLTNQYMAAATGLLAIRMWNTPVPNGWSGSPFDIAALALAFNREPINAQYKKAIDNSADTNSPGVVSDIIAANAQIDYLATQERAVRSRHMGAIRGKMHAAARRKGHAEIGGVLDGVARHVITIIESGIS